MTPPARRNSKEKAVALAMNAIKYIVWFGVIIASLATAFYTSQAGQDARTSQVCERVTAVETDVKTLHRVDENMADVVEATKRDLSKTREEMTKIATDQQAMVREQRKLSDGQQKLDEKMDDLKTILLRLDSTGNP